MGALTEQAQRRYDLTREEQDAFAAASHQRAARAAKNGLFDDEITPVLIPQRKGDPIEFRDDEGIRADTTTESLSKLKPAFAKDGTITAGTASQISDGACAVVVMSAEKAAELGLTPLAEIGAHGVVAGPDASLQTQPSRAIAKACAREGIDPKDLDLVEINEAFAAVGIVSTRELGVDPEKVNVNGGAIALGHPIGMSGARIVLHLALELRRRGGGVGAAALCGGGGQGDALILHVPARVDGRHCGRDRRSRRRPAGGGGGGLPTSPRWSSGAREGDARSVARLISLVEDASPALREVAAALAPHTGRAQVLGLTGSPGVGKSTTTTALVRALRAAGKRVGVLAVDPSSPFSGGALLGDRVRMQDHAGDRGVYIRSMASRGHLGGLAWSTPQALRVLDAAGCDVVLIETVGVGQSELEIASLADTTLVLVAPGMGDGIQAAKAGILEVADVFVVNKADRDGADHDGARPPLHAVPGRPARRARPLAPADREDRRHAATPTTASTTCWPRSRRTGSGWSPRARGTGGAASGPPARSRRSPWRRCASGSATCTARRRSVRWPTGWWRGRPTPTGPPTSCSTSSEARSRGEPARAGPPVRISPSTAPTAGSTGSRCSAAGR